MFTCLIIDGCGYWGLPISLRMSPANGERLKILTIPESRQILRTAINEVRQQYPFTICGWVLLPDHIHCLWTLPENDGNYSKRWGRIKAGFSKRAKNLFHRDEWLTDTKRKYRESTIWQRRFWEHMIRDEDDFSRVGIAYHFSQEGWP